MKQPNPKHKDFIREYIKDHNGKQAAIRAGYSEHSATQQASMILARPECQEFLRGLEVWKDAESVITAEAVIKELGRIALHDIGAFYKRNQYDKEKLKDLDELTAAQRACVKSIDVLEGKIEFHDKLGALEKLGKHFKLFTELHEQHHTFTMMGDVKIGGKKLEFNIGSPAPKK